MIVNCISTFGTRTSGASKRNRSFSPPSESGYYPSDWSTDDPAQNQELADYNNERLGVTQEQRLAMECGSMHGWGVPGADPGYYEQKMGGMKFG